MVAAVVDLAVEVKIGGASPSVEGALVPDFHGIQAQGIKAQLDLEGAQGEVHLVSAVTQSAPPMVTLDGLKVHHFLEGKSPCSAGDDLGGYGHDPYP